ncbi:hypothetical protein V3C99_006441 [Haemonchus contortus]
MLLLVLLAVFPSIYSLTCYNGLKLLRMQSVGQSTEECPASAYCYNMTASAALVVDVVKAGCSTWRCMLARDKCISTTFQFVPVSLCCCSYDRCNVGENPAYDSITSGGGGTGGWGGGGSGGSSGGWGSGGSGGNSGGWGGGGSQNGYDDSTNNNNNNNYNGWGNNDNNNNDNNNNYNGWGNNNDKKESLPTSPPSSGRWSPKQIEDKFKDYDVDHRDDNNNGGEEEFRRVDWRETPPPATRGGRNRDREPSVGREIELRV